MSPVAVSPLVLDAAAADAIAVLTLVSASRHADAAGLVDEIVASDEDVRRLLGGLVAVGAGLLALLEFYGQLPAEAALAQLGRAAAS